MTADITKLFALTIGMLCITALLIAKAIDPEVGMPILTAAIFYLIGNGVAVATGKRPTTLLTRTDVRERADDV